MSKRPFADAQVPAIYRRRIGNLEINVVSDGYFDVADDLWSVITPEELNGLKQNAHAPFDGFVRNAVNTYLVNTGQQLILIDSGTGELVPSGGRLADNLAKLDVTPADIDLIFITHLHPDHIGGLLKAGAAVFPNADVLVNERDIAHWTSNDAQNAAPEFSRGWFDVARAMLDVYQTRLRPFDGEVEVADGIRTVPLYGHTPGHTGCRLTSPGESLLMWADTCVSATVQFPRPDAQVAFDVQPEVAHETRKRLLAQLADQPLLITGTHLPFPSFGYVAKHDNAYTWIPDEWRYELES